MASKFEAIRVSDPRQLNDIYKLRYDSYFDANLIQIQKQGVLTDEFDSMDGTIICGLKRDDILLSTLRISVMDRYRRSTATYSSFSDILSPFLDAGETIVDGSRFAVNSRIADTSDVHLFTLRLAIMAAEHFDANFGVCAIKKSHIPFYKRYGYFDVACEERPYKAMLDPQTLMMVDYKEMREKIHNKIPELPASKDEMKSIFG